MSDREKIQRIARAINDWHDMEFDQSDDYDNAVYALQDIENIVAEA